MLTIRCPERHELNRFAHGQLDDDAMGELSSHLDQCASCRHQMDSVFGQEEAALALNVRADQRFDGETQLHRVLAAVATDATTRSMKVQRIAAAELLEQLGHYRIVRLLGQGGMGQVYLADDQHLQRRVALKVIKTQFASEEEAKRFQVEAEAAAKLQHPHIVPLYEAGEEGGRQYLTMAYIEGQTLGERVRVGPLPPREAATLLRQVAEAVHYAHTQNVIHRDLKPSNILVDHHGQARVMDFGLAKRNDSDSDLTQSGQVMGTPNFMPPEQAEGKNDLVGPLADVYALGATLYCLLTGRPPFQAASVVETLRHVVEREPVPPRSMNPAVPRDLETICLKCLEKRPDKRYSSAAAVADDLQRFLEWRSILAHPVGPTEKVLRWYRRSPLLALSLTSAVLVFLVAFGVVSWSYVRADEARRDEEKQRIAADRAKGEESKQRQAERWSRYLANSSATSSAFRLHNVEAARRFLDDAPEEHRGWEWQHFTAQLDDAQLVLRGHVGHVNLVCYSPDGRSLATTSDDRTVRLWDATTGQLRHTLRSKELVAVLAFSEDAAHLAVGSMRGDTTIWHCATGQQTFAVSASVAAERYLPVSPSAVVNLKDTFMSRLHLLEPSTGKTLATSTHDKEIIHYAQAPDGRLIATASADKTVRVWDTQTGANRATLRGHNVFVCAVRFSPDSQYLVSGGGYPDNYLCLWKVATNERLAVLHGHTNAIPWVVYASDGTRFASGSFDQTVRLWDGPTGKPLATLRGHTNWVNDIAFSPNNRYLVSAAYDRTLRLWDGTTGEFLAVLRGHTAPVARIAFRPDGSQLASAGWDGTIRLWDIEHLARRGVLRGHTDFVYAVGLSPDGRHVASASWDGTLRVWELTTGREVARLAHPDAEPVISLAFSPDGAHIATYARDFAVHWWHWPTGKEVRKLPLRARCPETEVAIDAKGERVAVGGQDGHILIWDAATGKPVADLATSTPLLVRSVAFDPSGQRLAGASNDGATGTFHVLIWDLENQKIVKVLTGHTHLVYTVGYSSDGRWLASGSLDGTVRVWDAKTLELAAVLSHGGNVYKVAFSPDQRRLATACADNTVRLWDMATFQEVAELHGHETYVHSLVWSPDGTRLVSGSGDKTVRIWDTLSAHERATKGK